MTRSSRRFLFPAATVILSVCSSCIYEDMPPCEAGDVDITIENDWRNAPDAGPEGMAYMFFLKGTDHVWRFDFPGRNAGKVTLPTGDYGFVMFNDDTSDIIFKKADDGTPFVTTAIKKMELDDRTVDTYEAPDMMWATSISDVKVNEEGVEYTYGGSIAGGRGSYLIKTLPRQITPTFLVKVLHVNNLQGVSAMKGILSGMASGINLYDGTHSETEADVFFTPLAEPDSTIDASFNTFGYPFHHKISNELRLYFILSDKRLVRRTYDVTDRILSAPDPMRVEIVIDSISLPYAPPPSVPGAFDPSVAGWTTVIVNLGT